MRSQSEGGAKGGFTSVDDLFSKTKAETSMERAILETLKSNDSLLKRKKDLYEKIRQANRRAAEGQLYQL